MISASLQYHDHSCNQQSQSQQSMYLAILCSFVIPALAACSLAALDFPLSFLAAFSLARSLWLPLVILDNVAVLRSEENTNSEIKAKYFRFGLLGRWVKEEISLMCLQNCRLFFSLESIVWKRVGNKSISNKNLIKKREGITHQVSLSFTCHLFLPHFPFHSFLSPIYKLLLHNFLPPPFRTSQSSHVALSAMG